MTIEEVIDLLKKDKSQRGKCFVSDALDIAINILEQEPVIKEVALEKIRKEITELDNEVCQRFLIEDIDKEVHNTYQECLEIIDKYI